VQLQPPQTADEAIAAEPIFDITLKVLIVESNPRIGGMLRRILQKWRVNCILVQSAQDATLRLATPDNYPTPINLVLLDWSLPDSAASILAKEIQQNVYPIHPKVIAMTPASSVFAKMEISELEVMARVLKPIDRSALRSTLHEFVRVHSNKASVQHTITNQAGLYAGLKVLLVEDNPVNQQFASILLQNIGCEVSVAADGFEALEQAKKSRFDIIFMDCQMPVMDGFEATEKIRKMEANPSLNMKHTPIIALTAHATAGYRDLCIAKGMDDYLSKPFNSSQIVEKLERWSRNKTDASVFVAGAMDQAKQVDAAPDIQQGGINGSGKPAAERFNEERLEQMAMIQLPGKPNLRDGLLKLYFENAPELASQIRTACSENDIDTLHRTSHSLKSTSANIGLDHLSRLAAKLEESTHAK
ncbi:MAG: response regulator, partial [Arenimonas sp.]